VEIGFNGRYCLDMLNATTAESIVFVLGGAGDPALIQPAEDGVQPLFVLMPMRM
jgi:DNA polymerase III sliding clamp (beta) subunit (PCNA family)